MNKQLPKVFPGTIQDNLNNTQEVFYSKNIKEDRSVNSNLSLESKINRIFKSPNFVYKKDVIITTNKKEVRKTIIGQTPDRLLTIDNDYIMLSDIVDIKAL